jgi:hypothetical protein
MALRCASAPLREIFKGLAVCDAELNKEPKVQASVATMFNRIPPLVT